MSKKIKKKARVDGSINKWDVYLNANTRYRFAICCDAGSEGIIMELKEGESVEITGTTFIGNKYEQFFDFTCKKSGNYKVYMSFKEEYKNKKKYCAIGLMGYIGKAN